MQQNFLLTLLYFDFAFGLKQIIQYQKLMKKQKRDLSFTTKQKKEKINLEYNTPIPSQKKIACFKQKQPFKENKSYAQDGSFLAKSTKSTDVKVKQRRKSLMCNKKTAKPVISQFHHNSFLDSKHKKIDKEGTDFFSHINSIKYNKPVFELNPFNNNFLLCRPFIPDICLEIKQEKGKVKIRQLQEENKTYQTTISAIKEEMSFYMLENQSIQQENVELKHKMSASQLQKQAQTYERKIKQLQLTSKCKKQQKNLQNRIKYLQKDLQLMAKLKDGAKQIVKHQQQNICQLQKEKQSLKQENQKQKQQTCQIERQKEAAKLKITGLQQQIQHLSQKLINFEELKKTYEQKLGHLENQKHRIKDNACELLEIIQKYRNQ